MSARPPHPDRPGRAFVPVLIGITLVVAVISSLGAPLLPDVADYLGVSLPTAQWSLTAALIAGAISAPVLGRLGDGRHRRQSVLWALVIVSAGGAIAGLADSLAVLVVGRFMQGIGLGLAPIAMAAARDHLDADRARRTIALLSVTGATGIGAGYPISGLIAEQLNVQDAFYFGAVLSALALVAAYLVIPSNKEGTGVSLDATGAAVGGIGVIALMVAIGQGHEWGWLSAGVVGCAVFAVASLALWVVHQLRAASPLVDLSQLRHRAVLGADVAAILLGVALYMFLTVITEFVQTPSAEGFGFGASTLVAGLCLVPFSVCSLIGTRLMTSVVGRFGVRAALGTGGVAIAASGVFFALVHTAIWQACVMMGLLGIGFGFTFAAIPGLIAGAVPAQEIGSAMGFYQVVRSIGFSLGSALVASILAGHELAGSSFPAVSGYTTALWVGAAAGLVAAVVAVLLAPKETGPTSAEIRAMARDDAELASAGLIDAEPEVSAHGVNRASIGP
ncbi:MAG TPA: MFS transporter [Solirubrobacterales bacterium]|nr:MFS transporter [Solirubrobacterales bacterium]